jgi:hypothetical protein
LTCLKKHIINQNQKGKDFVLDIVKTMTELAQREGDSDGAEDESLATARMTLTQSL